MTWQERVDKLHGESDPVNKLLDYYQSQHRPLSKSAILHVLEPLAGTSFLSIALTSLRGLVAWKKETGADTNLYPHDLFTAFSGIAERAQIDPLYDIRYLDRIPTHALLPQERELALERVFTFNLLADDEMLLLEGRTDDIYTDSTKETRVYSIATSQWTFYQRGEAIHTIPITRLYDLQPFYSMYAYIPEGSMPHSYYTDETQPAILAIPKTQQELSRGRRELYISRNFGERVKRNQS